MDRLLRVVGLGLAGCVVLAALAYAVLVAINWNDEPPSAVAQQLTRVALARAEVPDEDNGFVFVLGMGAPIGQDAFALGQTRKKFLDDYLPATLGDGGDFPGREVEYKDQRPAEIAALAKDCLNGDRLCVQRLERDPALVDRWLASEAWLLDRYRQLLQRDRWSESVPKDVYTPLPQYAHVINAQQLLLMEAWRQARTGNSETVREMLQQDLTFWRMALRSSDQIMSKMIAVAAIRRNFDLGNLALRELHAAGESAALPELWRAPLDDDERSMERPFAGEWRVLSVSMQALMLDRSELFQPRLKGALLGPLVKAEAINNCNAAYTKTIIDGLRADYRALPDVLDRIAPPGSEKLDHLYNPVGNILCRISANNRFITYGKRVADLEGIRRAALLAVDLRAEGGDDPRASMRATTLRDPYTDAPFEWKADTRSIDVAGLHAHHDIVL